MGQDVPHLLASRRFLPLFLTQFLGALNDNLFKNAMAILILYALAVGDGATGQVLVSLAAMVFILPFFLFSATAGQLADKVEKAGLVRIVKLCEILVMALGIVGLLWGNIPFLMAVLFLLGTQSTFFGPLKYGILPVHLAPGELIAGNGLIEAGTFLAILLGTIVGGLVILVDGGVIWIAVLTLTAAVGGYASSRFIPPAPPVDPGLTVSANILAETWRTITRLRDDRVLFLSVLGISWFWLIGVVFLSLFPAYAKDVLGADEKVVTLFLTVFSIGIGIGSLLCNKALKGEVSARHVPLGALLITLFTFDLVAASPEAPATELMGVGAFLNAPGSWRILIDLA
ncbi:MAG: MFS transporter, partial [Magnetospiraceae bacterium]